jgi:hypothetical protein
MKVGASSATVGMMMMTLSTKHGLFHSKMWDGKQTTTTAALIRVVATPAVAVAADYAVAAVVARP